MLDTGGFASEAFVSGFGEYVQEDSMAGTSAAQVTSGKPYSHSTTAHH
jgi:hypothetical protein